MILTFHDLELKYKNYTDIKGKVARDIKEGKLFKLKKGLYETDRKTPGSWLAGYIYGPSYISFESALAYYNLIPEAVYNVSSATFNKRKSKEYHNVFCSFYYHDIPQDAYPLGVKTIVQGNYSYSIATAEKALCDRIYIVPPIGSIKGLRELLFEDLRIEEEDFDKFDKQALFDIAPKYHSSNLNLLVKMIKGEKNDNNLESNAQ
ncbi:MAG: hypothetical protein PHY11_04070 [Bacilli bacterium]|nr:hypothetical protein [Bacilli bacterium]MDD3422522.1 hypothetical protein [Bacilli bacterium]MDD4066149.1 hypothetical protein [Bacilli bacterium]